MPNILQCDGKQALIRIGPGHGKENAPDALDYSGSYFEQFELESVDRGGSQLGSGKAPTQVPQKNEGEGVQKQSKLVGLKPGATQPIGFEMKFELLDPVLGHRRARCRCRHKSPPQIQKGCWLLQSEY